VEIGLALPRKQPRFCTDADFSDVMARLHADHPCQSSLPITADIFFSLMILIRPATVNDVRNAFGEDPGVRTLLDDALHRLAERAS
jgi:hypothetical protein